jgi:hypothetical protein
VTCIYCLFSTADGRPRYIGQTTKPPPVRHAQHLRHAERRPNTPLHRWIRRVQAAGFQVRIHVLQTDVQPRDLNIFERYWMAQFRGLLNTVTGTTVAVAETEVGRAVRRRLRQQLQEAGPAILGACIDSLT